MWKWCLVSPLTWELGKPGSGFVLTIEEGFVSDLVTIPFWLHWLIDPTIRPRPARPSSHDALLAQGFEQRVSAGRVLPRV